MSQYGDLLKQSLSMETKDKVDDTPELANEPGYVDQSDVLIQLPVGMSSLDHEVTNLGQSLESRGWRVKIQEYDYSSMEGSSDGVNSGSPAMNANNANNTVVNGIFIPELKDSDVYKVVQVIRPEDTVAASNSKILYLMNDEGEIKDLLKSEGHLVANETDALHLLLAGQSDGSSSDGDD